MTRFIVIVSSSLMVVAALAGCATTLIDAEEAVTIQQGVYGLTISGCDVGDCQDSPYANAPITITPASGGTAMNLTSDGDGFFEMSLAAGDYTLCVHSCTTIAVADGSRVRRDFMAGPGGGVWCIDGVCRPGQ